MSEDGKSKAPGAAHPGETLLGVLSAIVLAVLCGFLVVSAATDEDRPADIRVEVVGAMQVGTGSSIEVAARNLGDRTAAEVMLRGVNAAGETAEARYDYLPPGSERHATLVFGSPTTAADVVVTVAGFADP